MKNWLSWATIIFLALVAAHFYAQYRLADRAAVDLLKINQAQMQYINNQCVQILGSQGFQVLKVSPPEPEPEEGEVEEEK